MVVYSSSFYSCGHDHAVDICACKSKGIYVCECKKINSRGRCTQIEAAARPQEYGVRDILRRERTLAGGAPSR